MSRLTALVKVNYLCQGELLVSRRTAYVDANCLCQVNCSCQGGMVKVNYSCQGELFMCE